MAQFEYDIKASKSLQTMLNEYRITNNWLGS
jgi:hypothetical protein